MSQLAGCTPLEVEVAGQRVSALIWWQRVEVDSLSKH